jgi:antitoxin FitA
MCKGIFLGYKNVSKLAAETAVQYQTGGDIAKAREAVARSQARYATQNLSDSTELIREDRER